MQRHESFESQPQAAGFFIWTLGRTNLIKKHYNSSDEETRLLVGAVGIAPCLLWYSGTSNPALLQSLAITVPLPVGNSYGLSRAAHVDRHPAPHRWDAYRQG